MEASSSLSGLQEGEKTAAGFGVKFLIEKESRKVGKIRKYENPPTKNLFEGIIRQT